MLRQTHAAIGRVNRYLLAGSTEGSYAAAASGASRSVGGVRLRVVDVTLSDAVSRYLIGVTPEVAGRVPSLPSLTPILPSTVRPTLLALVLLTAACGGNAAGREDARLVEAAASGDLESVMRMLDGGADVDSRGAEGRRRSRRPSTAAISAWSRR